MKYVVVFMFIITLYCLIGQIDNDRVRKLIDKIDSVHIKEREEALNELKKMSQSDEKIMDVLKFESDNESNSYNTRFFLKKLVKDIEESKNKPELKKSEHTDSTTEQQKNDKESSIKLKSSQGKISITQGKISITLCNNNKCQQYEASSCEELLQKYPNLKGKVNCNNDAFAFGWGNGQNGSVDDIRKRFKELQDDIWKDKFGRRKEWSKKLNDIIGGRRSDERVFKNRMNHENVYKYNSFGFDTEEITEEELKNLKIDAGVRVKNMEKDGFGETVLKLQDNDIIISINDEKIYNNWILKRQLNPLLNGIDVGKIIIMRNGKIQELNY